MITNRTLFSLVLGLAACCGQLSGQAPPADPNASVTAPVLSVAPYVQSLSAESVAILWQTTEPAYGWIEYGTTPALGAKQDATIHGLRVANVTEHRVVLAGLHPGTSYWYRVCFKPIRKFGAYRVDFGPMQCTEATAFRTLPGPKQQVTALIYNDLHTNVAAFQQLRQVAGNTPFEFSLFNGDCLADPSSEKQVLATLTTLTQGAQAGNRPVFFVRGNHETRGAFARALPRCFAWPGDKPYFAFNAGAVRWVVLDCGEDKPDDHSAYSGLADFDSFRREETVWLKTEIASRAFRKAAWRVLVSHMPIYAKEGQATNHNSYMEQWSRLLAKAHVDLAIHAHTHHAAFYPVGKIGNSYPIAVGGSPTLKGATAMILEADSRRLKLRILNASGNEAFPVYEKKR